jgi:hypothetical protein
MSKIQDGRPAAILKKATVGEKQLYLNNQSPKYNNFGVYLHILGGLLTNFFLLVIFFQQGIMFCGKTVGN